MRTKIPWNGNHTNALRKTRNGIGSIQERESEFVLQRVLVILAVIKILDEY